MTGGFQFQYCGECLGGMVPNGATLTADPKADFGLMDIVAVVLNMDEAGPFAPFMNGIGATYAGVTKIYLGQHKNSRGETIYRLGQLNPPLVTPMPASIVESIAKVIDADVSDDFRGPSAIDMEALELLYPFAVRGETVQ